MVDEIEVPVHSPLGDMLSLFSNLDTPPPLSEDEQGPIESDDLVSPAGTEEITVKPSDLVFSSSTDALSPKKLVKPSLSMPGRLKNEPHTPESPNWALAPSKGSSSLSSISSLHCNPASNGDGLQIGNSAGSDAADYVVVPLEFEFPTLANSPTSLSNQDQSRTAFNPETQYNNDQSPYSPITDFFHHNILAEERHRHEAECILDNIWTRSRHVSHDPQMYQNYRRPPEATVDPSHVWSGPHPNHHADRRKGRLNLDERDQNQPTPTSPEGGSQHSQAPHTRLDISKLETLNFEWQQMEEARLHMSLARRHTDQYRNHQHELSYTYQPQGAGVDGSYPPLGTDFVIGHDIPLHQPAEWAGVSPVDHTRLAIAHEYDRAHGDREPATGDVSGWEFGSTTGIYVNGLWYPSRSASGADGVNQDGRWGRLDGWVVDPAGFFERGAPSQAVKQGHAQVAGDHHRNRGEAPTATELDRRSTQSNAATGDPVAKEDFDLSAVHPDRRKLWNAPPTHVDWRKIQQSTSHRGANDARSGSSRESVGAKPRHRNVDDTHQPPLSGTNAVYISPTKNRYARRGGHGRPHTREEGNRELVDVCTYLQDPAIVSAYVSVSDPADNRTSIHVQGTSVNGSPIRTTSHSPFSLPPNLMSASHLEQLHSDLGPSVHQNFYRDAPGARGSNIFVSDQREHQGGGGWPKERTSGPATRQHGNRWNTTLTSRFDAGTTHIEPLTFMEPWDQFPSTRGDPEDNSIWSVKERTTKPKPKRTNGRGARAGDHKNSGRKDADDDKPARNFYLEQTDDQTPTKSSTASQVSASAAISEWGPSSSGWQAMLGIHRSSNEDQNNRSAFTTDALGKANSVINRHEGLAAKLKTQRVLAVSSSESSYSPLPLAPSFSSDKSYTAGLSLPLVSRISPSTGEDLVEEHSGLIKHPSGTSSRTITNSRRSQKQGLDTPITGRKSHAFPPPPRPRMNSRYSQSGVSLVSDTASSRSDNACQNRFTPNRCRNQQHHSGSKTDQSGLFRESKGGPPQNSEQQSGTGCSVAEEWGNQNAKKAAACGW